MGEFSSWPKRVHTIVNIIVKAKSVKFTVVNTTFQANKADDKCIRCRPRTSRTSVYGSDCERGLECLALHDRAFNKRQLGETYKRLY